MFNSRRISKIAYSLTHSGGLRGDRLLLVNGWDNEEVSPRGREKGDAERARVNAGMDSERDGIWWRVLEPPPIALLTLDVFA